MSRIGRWNGSAVDVAIVGGGAAGLAAARRLGTLRPDLTVVVLEAAERIGGRAFTRLAGPERLPVDLGCGWMHGAKDNAWMRIAQDLRFDIDHALAPWDGAGRDLGLDPADHEEAQDAIGAFFARADEMGAGKPDRTIGAALEEGNRWNGFIGAVGTFINGVELEKASLHDYHRYSPGRGPDCRLTEGYGRLIETFGAPVQVAYGTIVTAIHHGGLGIRIDTNCGTQTARAAIVAVPTSVLAADAIRFVPALPEKNDAASRLPLGLANKLFLHIDEAGDLPTEGHALGSALRTRTASYHVRPFGRPLIECYFGGDLARDLERAGEMATTAFALEELSVHFGTAIRSRLSAVALSAWASAPHIGGSYSYAKPGAADERAVLAAPVGERLFFAGEACSAHRYSTAHGAYETGIAAAEAAAAHLTTA